MSTYLKKCGGAGTTRNTGFKDESCLESLLELPIISNGFKFPTIGAFQTVADWKAAIAAKSLVPLFDVYEVADASTEDVFFESGNFKRRTEKGKEVLTAEMYLSICAFAALKSLEGSSYLELFEFNQDGDYSGVYDADGVQITGRKIKSLTVDRKRATKEKVAYVTVEIIFEDKDDVLDRVITTSDLSKDDLDGIYDVYFEQVSASATEIKFKAKSDCAGGADVTSLVEADIELLDLSGAAHTHTFVAADAEGIYTLNGLAFLTDFTIGTVGVVTNVDTMYESPEVLKIVVT